MEFNFDLINTLVLTVLTSNFILGFFIYVSDKKDVIHKNFFIFASTTMAWGLTMFLFRSFPDHNDGFFARILYASASTIPFVFLYFIRVFPNESFSLSRRWIQILSLPFLVVFSISLLTDYLIVDSYSRAGKEPVILFHNLYHTLYAIYINIYFGICYVILFLKYFKSSGIERIQIAYVIVGTLVGTVIGVTTNLTMPYLGNFDLNWMGQIGVISMVGAIAYSIMKHRLFDMKVLATQFTVVLLCVALFTRVLFSTDRKDFVINNILLVVTVTIGIFLIKSVIKEVKLREEVEKLAEQLKLANQGQVNLIHFMNHQIKGRLGNAKNIFAELLTDDYGVMPESVKPLLQKGLDETSLGVEYVQGVLRGESAEKGTLPYEFKVLDFSELVKKAFDKQKDRGEQKGLKMSLEVLEGEYKVNADETQLGEAVRNLIDNSINYTLEGEIKVSAVEDKYSVKMIVQDTGIGLTEEDKANLFKSGGRGSESLKINVNSTGYGLAFVKGVVDAHKGRVWADSQGRGEGSIFFIEIPKA